VPDEPGWRVRVVPNKFPIVDAHEVVVLSPAHNRDFAALADTEAIEVVTMLRDRCAFHLRQGRMFAQAFVNHGRAAGASIEHPHAQVIALDTLPPRVRTRLGLFTPEAFGRDHRNVVTHGAFAVWCPPASPTPFVQRAALLDAGARFDELSDGGAKIVAVGLRDALARLATALGDVAYNAVVVTAPRDVDRPFHWWIEIVPRITVIGGFELGTGINVNVVPPADAARMLRDA
jgi:UDPglucose--hexose-1-phosphate uridylyltransferase